MSRHVTTDSSSLEIDGLALVPTAKVIYGRPLNVAHGFPGERGEEAQEVTVEAEVHAEAFVRNPQIIAELGKGRLFDFQTVRDVVLRCSGRHAAFSSWMRERVWHPAQTMTDLPDGGVELRLPEVSRMWLIRWVLALAATSRSRRRRMPATSWRPAANNSWPHTASPI